MSEYVKHVERLCNGFQGNEIADARSYYLAGVRAVLAALLITKGRK